MNGSSLLKEIGRSYIVSSFIPASLFVFVFSLVFKVFISNSLAYQLRGENASFYTLIVFLLLFTFWLAFALFSSQDRITKLFEGYSIPTLFTQILTLVQKSRYRKQTERIEEVRDLLDQPLSPINNEKLEELYPLVMSDLQTMEIEAPLDMDHMLPTRLGNVLRASELYPYYRYGIDGITIWPRLYTFLPKELKEDLQETNNQLAFLLNSSLLFSVFALACTIAAGIGHLCKHNNKLLSSLCNLETLQNGFNHYSLLHFLVFGIIGWLFAYGIYRFGIGAAETYGLYIRVAYDLHRNKLLEYLNQTLTQSLEDDKNTWEKIGDFFIAGDLIKPIRFGSPKNLQQSKIIPGLAFAGGVLFGLLFKLVRSNRGRRAMV